MDRILKRSPGRSGLTTEGRFWRDAEKTDGCWIWRGAAYGTRKGKSRYGRIYSTEQARYLTVHRYAYELLRGEIPEGMVVDHLCENTFCVNPEHLELVTARENNERNKRWAGNRTHAPCGHLLDLPVPGDTGRRCHFCRGRKGVMRGSDATFEE